MPLSNAHSSDKGALPLPPSHPKLDAFKKLVGADLVHKLGYTGRGVTVAVIDDGIQANHVQFQNRILAEVCVSNDFEPSFNPYVCKKQGSGLYVRDDSVNPNIPRYAYFILVDGKNGSNDYNLAQVRTEGQPPASAFSAVEGDTFTIEGIKIKFLATGDYETKEISRA